MIIQKPKRLLFVANSSWSMWNFRQETLSSLQKELDSEIHIAAPRDMYSKKLVENGFIFHEIIVSAKGTNPIKDIQLSLALYRIYKKTQPDLIIHYTIKPNIYGPIASRVNGIPCISVITGLGYAFLNTNLITIIARTLYLIGLHFATEVWFLNQSDLEIFLNHRLVSESKTHLFPGEGINLERFKPFAPTHPTESIFTFLMIGRLLKDKGIYEYVDAVKKARALGIPFRAQIIGKLNADNPTAISAQELTEWVSDGVIEYLQEAEDIRPYIASADCIVLPSYREGISRSLLEGAAMEKPLIASNVPGCRELIVHGQNGYLIPSKDPQALSEAMISMLSLSKEELSSFGKRGRHLVKQGFSNEKILSKYIDRISNILKHKK